MRDLGVEVLVGLLGVVVDVWRLMMWIFFFGSEDGRLWMMVLSEELVWKCRVLWLRVF